MATKVWFLSVKKLIHIQANNNHRLCQANFQNNLCWFFVLIMRFLIFAEHLKLEWPSFWHEKYLQFEHFDLHLKWGWHLSCINTMNEHNFFWHEFSWIFMKKLFLQFSYLWIISFPTKINSLIHCYLSLRSHDWTMLHSDTHKINKGANKQIRKVQITCELIVVCSKWESLPAIKHWS